MSAAVTVSGVPELQRALDALKHDSPSIATAGMKGFLTAVERGIKRGVPARYRATVGSRFSRTGSRGPVAKVGFGVGRQSRRVRKSRSGGVGISKRNIHWIVLGTRSRVTRSGANRGSTSGNPNWVSRGYSTSKQEALEAFRVKALARIQAKAAQARRA